MLFRVVMLLRVSLSKNKKVYILHIADYNINFMI